MTEVTTVLEDRLRDAFGAARDSTIEHPDLFVRVERSIDDARLRRRFRLRLAFGVTLFVAANAALLALCSDVDDGRLVMPWWSIELVTNIVLVALAVGLGPFIKRFGRAYAADVFRANPRTGKSYLVLTDVAYYLIFTAFHPAHGDRPVDAGERQPTADHGGRHHRTGGGEQRGHADDADHPDHGEQPSPADAAARRPPRWPDWCRRRRTRRR